MSIHDKYEPKREDYETEEEFQHALAAFDFAWACAEQAAKEERLTR